METKKSYKLIKSADGKTLTLQMLKPDADGITRSAQCPYPLVLQVWNEATQKNEMKKQTRKQTEKYLLGVLGYKA